LLFFLYPKDILLAALLRFYYEALLDYPSPGALLLFGLTMPEDA